MKRIVARGFLWVVSTMALARAARYLSFLLLGGMLAPEEFGQFAAIFVVVNGFTLFQGFGLGQALLLRRERVDEASDTIFILSLALGVLFLALAWVSAPLLRVVFGQTDLAGPYRLCSLVVLFRALQTVPSRRFEKDLAFSKQLAPGLAGSVVYAATALVLATRGAGVWALAGAEAAAAAGEMIAYWIQSPWRPRFRFDRSLAWADLSVGWVVLGGTLLVFLYQGVDRVAIGKILSTRELGTYAFAFTLASVPASYAVRALNTVLLPSYASGKATAGDRTALFLRATSYACALGSLFVIGVASLGGRFLEAAYGEKWLDARGALTVLAFLGLFHSFSSLSEDLVVGIGRPAVFRRISALRFALAAAGVWAAARWAGILGVALVMALAMLASSIAGWAAALRLLGAPARELGRAVARPLVAAAAVAPLAAGAARGLPPDVGVGAVVALGVLLAAVYAAVWLGIDGVARTECAKWLAPANLARGPRGDGGER